MQMYYEYDIRKEIKRLTKLRDKFVPGTHTYDMIKDRINGLKWVLGE